MPHPIRRRSVLAAALLAPLAVACSPAAAQAPTGPDEWADFDAYLRERVAADKFSGAVLVTRGDRTLLEAAYGRADRDTGAPNTPATSFCIGSMGKMFTAVAVAQLVERGALSFDDTVGAHLTGFPPEIADTVTVHHMLTHTSGMGDIFDGQEVTEANHTIAALVDRIRAQPLRFAPGSSSAYSNAGFVVLGAIVESVSGRPYADQVHDEVLVPAGMAATAVRSYRPAEVPGMAQPYALMGPDGKPFEPTGPESRPPADAQLADVGDELKGASPAGGALSTVGDMTAFARALLGHRLLGPQLTETVLSSKGAPQRRPEGGPTPVPGPAGGPGPAGPPREPPRIGYGFMEQRINGVRIVGHNGGTPGYEGQLDIYPDTGHTVVVLTNQDGVMPPVIRRSEELLTG